MFYSKKKKDIKRGWSFSFVRSVFNLGFYSVEKTRVHSGKHSGGRRCVISWGTWSLNETPASRLLPESKPVCEFPGACGLPALSRGPGSVCLYQGSRGAWRGGPPGGSQGSTHSRPPAYTHLTLRCLHRPCGWAAYAHVPERSRQPGRGRQPADSTMVRE